MVVQHNITAMNSNRMLGLTQKTLSSSTEKLSSGYAINRAADNAAGLAISEKMRKQIRGLTQASTNAEDGISAVQTAEGALTEVHDMLQRMNELAVQAANGTNSEDDRSYIQDEIDQLTQEIDRVAETTKFNEIYLLKGDTTNTTGTGYTYAYKTYGGSTAATASFTKETSTGLYVKSITFTSTASLTSATAADCTTLASLLKSQGLTIGTASYSTASGTQVGYTLQLNGSDATSNYNVVTISGITGSFQITNSSGAVIAEITLGSTSDAVEYTYDLTDSEATSTVTLSSISSSSALGTAAKLTADGDVTDVTTVTLASGDVIYEYNGSYYDSTGEELDDVGYNSDSSLESGLSEITTAYAATAATYSNDVVSLYDKDGNAISANNLSSYYTATGGTISTTSGMSIYANAGVKVYDALGNEVSAASYSSLIFALKDQTAALKLSLQVGADGTSNNKITINIDAMTSKGLGINGLRVDGNDDTNATNAIQTIAAAIKKVSEQRAALGAVQNRLEHTINNLDNIVENTTDAESSIRDTDMATEMVTYSNANILAQAGQSMLAQANQSNQGVLSLLG